MDEIIGFMNGLDGVLTIRPASGDGSPEISWGDTFFFYSPDGVTPATAQPFATIVTKNYPGDEASRLDRPDTFRVNIFAGKAAFIRWTGHAPREPAIAEVDPSAADTVIAHPVYGTVGPVRAPTRRPVSCCVRPIASHARAIGDAGLFSTIEIRNRHRSG